MHLVLLLLMGAVFLCRGGVLIGIQTSDAVLLSSTSSFTSHDVVMTTNYPWIHSFSSPYPGHNAIGTLVGLHGDPADCDLVLEEIKKETMYFELAFRRCLSTHAIAHLCRKVISNNLRSRQLAVNALIAGREDIDDVDIGSSSKTNPVLYYVDSIGAIQKVPYACHGSEFISILSYLDRKNNIDGQEEQGAIQKLSVEEGFKLIQDCWTAVRKRSSNRLDLSKCKVIGITAEGASNYGLL